MHIAYFAGLFDGEGTVGIYAVGRKYWSVRMQIVGTHNPMIKSVYNFIGKGSFTAQKRQGKITQIHNKVYEDDISIKQGWRWTLCDRQSIRNVLIDILPYLIEKKDQALIAIDFIDGNLDGDSASILCKEAKRFKFPLEDTDDIVYNKSNRIPWNKGKKGLQEAWNKGKKGVSEETRKRMSESAIKRHSKNYNNPV